MKSQLLCTVFRSTKSITTHIHPPIMAIFTAYVHTFMEEIVVVFKSDMQTTTIAIAITGSLCASLIWLIFSLASQGQGQGKAKKKSGSCAGRGLLRRSSVMSSFHLNRRLSQVSISNFSSVSDHPSCLLHKR